MQGLGPDLVTPVSRATRPMPLIPMVGVLTVLTSYCCLESANPTDSAQESAASPASTLPVALTIAVPLQVRSGLARPGHGSRLPSATPAPALPGTPSASHSTGT
jgi:hypothetical protein